MFSMALRCSWFSLALFSGFLVVGCCDQAGFLSLSYGIGSFVDSYNIQWVSDNEYISSGNTTRIEHAYGASSSSVPLRFFPKSQGRNCYRLLVKNLSALVLVRAQFVYKNYDGLEKPPAFTVSLATAITIRVNLSTKDPWTEEFIWPVSKDTLPFCLLAIPHAGSPVISPLEVRPLPQGAYQTGLEDLPNKSIRKSYLINRGYTNESLQ